MATPSPSSFVQLAKTLPAPLLRFFARWPPAAVLPAGSSSSAGSPSSAAAAAAAAAATPTPDQAQRPDPFRFYKHPQTGRWHGPAYSARRQAQLVQMAREHGVEELLSTAPKAPTTRLARRVEFGLRVKGTGVGQRVKGHIYERQIRAKMEKRRKAMLEMPALIRAWKRTGKRNWTKFPK